VPGGTGGGPRITGQPTSDTACRFSRDDVDMGIFRRRRAAQLPEEWSGYPNPDRHTVEQLVASGADLTQPRHVLFYVYAADSATADTIAQSIHQQTGLDAAIHEAANGDGSWCIEAEHSGAVLTPDWLTSTKGSIEAVAAEHGSEYDGWVASV
jgi:hypothetical protein